MGKNLKGKEIGKGIYQRKDGLYHARFVDRAGKRHEKKYFGPVPEARNWIEEANYADTHENVFVATDTTVDEWFNFWIENMDADYAGSTIRQTYIAMDTMFKAVKMNDLISKHPMDGIRFTKPIRATDDIKFLIRGEQQIFFAAAKRSHNYNQYALILGTGLRAGELIGLTWDAIDFEKKTLTVNNTLDSAISKSIGVQAVRQRTVLTTLTFTSSVTR